MFHRSGPGKLSPKLNADFLAFDPLRGRPNVLVDHSPPHGEGPQVAPSIGSCRHEYTVKHVQSAPPPLDLRSDGTTVYKLAVVCKRCRIHADIRIDHSNSTNPCPTSEHPLHHFQRVPSYDKITEDRIRYAWQCSVEGCQATLFIYFRRSRLDEEDITLLISPELLKGRYDALVREDPKRDGLRLATPMESLQRLRKYIKDSLNPQHSKRVFPSNNKRFQEAFGMDGQDCRDLLEHIGFTYNDHTWSLPNPEPIHDVLQSDGSSPRELLQDVEIELLACMFKLSAEQGLVNTAAEEGWHSANGDIERTFAAQGYHRYVSPRRNITSNAELPFFNSLGALPDFSDYLIEYAYDRQTLCDPEMSPYYFECLQEITDSRQTEQLHMKVATLQSQDIVSRRDLSAAYRYFNIPFADARNIEDPRILEIFQAQQPDLGPQAQEQARAHLYKIGVSRDSHLLVNASRQSVETYEDALAWLGNGVTKDTADEGILAVLAIKTGDSAENEEIGKKAISVIARARQSSSLNNWLLTGRTDSYTMNVDEALSRLGLPQKLDDIDPSVLAPAFEIARSEQPGEITDKAIATIQEALSKQRGITIMHSPESWPVGLLSHGNTCYLNSVLQFYFSIKPLRDIVLNYDQYKVDPTSLSEKVERVGRRQVTTVEIIGGQRFAQDLKELFELMIKSAEMRVRPQEDLVFRAFLEPEQYKLLDPPVEGEKEGETDEAMANGVSEPTGGVVIDEQPLDTQAETLAGDKQGSGASSTTLQASTNGEDTDTTMQNVELPPTPPGSPGGLKGGGAQVSSNMPPLPPRRKYSAAKAEIMDIVQRKARAQQDASEVHDAAMFRLRCGMKPTGCDEFGEQMDALADIFSFQLTDTVVDEGVKVVDAKETKLPIEPIIGLGATDEGTDVYAALDAVFDLQTWHNDLTKGVFKSFIKLPPLLQLNIDRAGYKTEGGGYKVVGRFGLQDELYLDRYCRDSHPDILAKRQKCWEWRRRLQTLKKEQKIISKTSFDLDGPEALAQTAEYLASLDQVNRELEAIGIEVIEADGEITEALSTEAKRQYAAVAAFEAEIEVLQKQLDEEFADMQSMKYRLAAVFFHRGVYGSGHYWIYIHDFANSMWRAYNDESVEEFERVNEIFEATAWAHGTPTFAVYVDANKLDMVQPLCRNPEPQNAAMEQPPPALTFDDDVEMVENVSQQPPDASINPKLTVEGGENDWDDPRLVAAEPNCDQSNENRRVRFAGSRVFDDKSDQFLPSRADSCSKRHGRIFDDESVAFLASRASSPCKRHGPQTGSPTKTQKLDGSGSRASKFSEMFELDSNPGLGSDEGSWPSTRSPPSDIFEMDLEDDVGIEGF